MAKETCSKCGHSYEDDGGKFICPYCGHARWGEIIIWFIFGILLLWIFFKVAPGISSDTWRTVTRWVTAIFGASSVIGGVVGVFQALAASGSGRNKTLPSGTPQQTATHSTSTPGGWHEHIDRIEAKDDEEKRRWQELRAKKAAQERWESDYPKDYAKKLLENKDYSGLINAWITRQEHISKEAYEVLVDIDFALFDQQTINLLQSRIEKIFEPGKPGYRLGKAAYLLSKTNYPRMFSLFFAYFDVTQVYHVSDPSDAFHYCPKADWEHAIDDIHQHLLEHENCPIEMELLNGISQCGGEQVSAIITSRFEKYLKEKSDSTIAGLELDQYVNMLSHVGVWPFARDALNNALVWAERLQQDLRDRAFTGHFATGTISYHETITKIQDLIKKIT